MRRQLTHRPALLVAAALASGLVLRQHPYLLLALVPLVALGGSAGHRAAILVAGLLGCLLSPPRVSSIHDLRFVEGTGTVINVPRWVGASDGAILEVGGARYVAYFDQAEDVSYRDRLNVTAIAHPLKEGTDSFWAAKGVVGRLDFVRVTPVSKGPALIRWGRSWRNSFMAFTTRYLPASRKQIVDALCFNVEAGLDQGLQESLRRTGTVHIISASGLHVGIFALVLQGILSKLPIPRHWQLVLLMAVLIAYTGATGMRPPVIRSVVMAGIVLSGYLFRKEGDLLSALGVATGMQLLWDPWSVYDLGLHLSFIAVLGLGMFVRFDADTGRSFVSWLKTRSIQTAHASLVAGLATAPVVAWHFGIVSVISVVANLFVTPLVGVIVPASLVGWAVSVWPPAAKTAMIPVGWCCYALDWVVRTLGAGSFSAVDVPVFSAWWIPVAYLAMIGLWREHVRPA